MYLSWDQKMTRLDELSRLPTNWDSYGADCISSASLARARDVLCALKSAFEQSVGESFMPLNVAPIADGGIQLEWGANGSYLEVELTADGGIAYFTAHDQEADRQTRSAENIPIDEVVPLVAAFLHVAA